MTHLVQKRIRRARRGSCARLCGVAVVVLIATVARAAPAPDDLFPPRPAIKPDHPRLLLRPRETKLAIPLADLRSIPHDADFKAIVERLKSQDDAAAQAMVWLLTNDAAAAEKAVRRMRAYRIPAKVDTFHIYFRLREFAFAYDWLHDCPAFDRAARDEVRANVTPLAREGLRQGDDHVFHNYTWMSSGGVALWALATAGEDAASDEVYDAIRGRFNERLYPTLRYLDALPSEPMGYWSFYVFTPGLFTLLAVQSATETDLVSAVRNSHGDWLNRNLDTLVHGTLPSMRFIPWGDLQGGPNGGVTDEMAGAIDAATWATGSADGRWFGRWLADKRGLQRYRGETAVFHPLYARRTSAAAGGAMPKPPQALSFLAGGPQGGQFTARSGWGDGDTIVGFRCADFLGNHHHYDQGGFWLYRRGLLAVDPPVYRTVGGPQQPTDVHNALLIGGQPQRAAKGQTFNTLEKFKQNLTAGKRLETGDITFTHDAGPWAAVAGQYAQAYDCPELASCVRQLLFVRPGTLVIVDRLTAKPGKQVPEIQWLLQLPSAPRDVQGGVAADNGKAWIRCRDLLPAGFSKKDTSETPVGPHRVTFTYAGKSEVVLAHVLDVGDGTEPPAAAEPVQANASGRGLAVTLGGVTYTFAGEPPYAVRASKGEGR
jgi:hypothetical protein